MDEYKEIQGLRALWWRSIMTWGQIFIPLGAAIISFFITQLLNFVDRGWGSPFLLLGWALFTFCMVYWRWVAHNIDSQIVQMYPRMLELEKSLGMETQASYYYSNLHKRAKQQIAKRIGVQYGELKQMKYRDFVQKISAKQINSYDLLLTVWDEFGPKSVTSRGHKLQDCAVSVASLVLLALISVGTCLNWFA